MHRYLAYYLHVAYRETLWGYTLQTRYLYVADLEKAIMHFFVDIHS